MEVFLNGAAGAVTSGGTDAPASGTSETLTVTASAAFPAASASAVPPTWFHFADPAAPSEVMLATAAPGGTGTGQSWTVTRGADGTTPVTHATGYAITQVVPAGFLNALATDAWTYVGSGGGAPAFGADWANYGHGTPGLAFRAVGGPSNEVRVNGVVQPSAGATGSLFSVPSGLIPASTQMLWGINGSTGAACFWQVAASTGLVTLMGATGVLGAGDWYAINGEYSLNI